MNPTKCYSRRTFLRASIPIVLGTAGCIESNDALSDTRNFQRRRVRIPGQATLTVDGTEVSLDVSDGTADEASPALLTATASNVGDRLVSHDIPCKSVVGHPVYSADREYVLVRSRYSYDHPVDCWQRTSDDAISGLGCTTNVRLASDESWSNELALWATKGGPCMPTGSFDFEKRLSYLEGNPTFEFTLRVEEA